MLNITAIKKFEAILKANPSQFERYQKLCKTNHDRALFLIDTLEAMGKTDSAALFFKE